MKTLKKFGAMLFAALFVLTMMVPAFASSSDPTLGDITVATGDTHSYEVYQIFTGSGADGSTLGTPKWGLNGTGYDSSKTEQDAVPKTVLEALEAKAGSTDNTVKLGVILEYVNLNSTPFIATVSAAAPANNIPAGYYLIRDKNVPAGDTATTFVTHVAGTVEIVRKAAPVIFDKGVYDKNDTDQTHHNTEAGESADYDIGDNVPFVLTATLPANYNDYKHYKMVFHDTMENTLKFNNDVTLKVDGHVVPATEYEVTTTTNDGCTFHVTIPCAKELSVTTAPNLKVTVDYTAELLSTANIGNQGNQNKAKLEYANNPNWTGFGTNGENPKPGTDEPENPDHPKPGETPPTPPTTETEEEFALVFTYQLVFNKVNEEKNEDGTAKSLAGAFFKLYKHVPGGGTTEIVPAEADNGTATTFNFKGLDDGTYTLKETKVPAGYNKMEDITFKVEAGHLSYDGTNRTDVLDSLTGSTITGSIDFTVNEDEGSLAATIVNQKGGSLPSTGGMGTTLFYVVGGLMVAGAGVLMITRKRMEGKN